MRLVRDREVDLKLGSNSIGWMWPVFSYHSFICMSPRGFYAKCVKRSI